MRFCSISLVMLLLASLGCDFSKPNRRLGPRSGVAAGSDQEASLLKLIRGQLRKLPEATELELSPPLVVLDKRATNDGEDILAVLQRPPGVVDGPANVLVAKTGRVNFRDKVRPGDIAKYYATYDQQTIDRMEQAGDVGIATYKATELTIAQVISEDTLLIEGGAAAEFTVPSRLEIWRVADDRMNQINNELGAYVVRREPPLAWHPSPDAAEIKELTDRLNQWLRQSKVNQAEATTAESIRDQLLQSLPDSLTSNQNLAPLLSKKELNQGYFAKYEVRQIQGAIWRRDVARWARGSENGTMPIARSLFDWTVRNLQLVDAEGTPPRWPWEMMLHSRATAAGRAWVFVGLCAQQNLTTAIVTVPTGDEAQRVLVGVLDGDALRLFDPTLGLPLSDSTGGLVHSLAGLQQDGKVLRQFDLPDNPYPVTSDLLKKASVELVATPLAISRRAAALESQLTAADALVLSLDVEKQAERLKQASGVDEVSLWAYPFITLAEKYSVKESLRKKAVKDFLPFAWRPRLWRARTQHFRGDKASVEEQKATTAETADDHRDARRYYTSRRVRPADQQLENEPPEKQAIYLAGKVAATLNLALLTYDEGAYRIAKGWLENSALDGESAAEVRPAVRYNLARTYQKLGEPERAVELLQAIEGPMAPGAKLLAQRISETNAADDAKEQSTANGDEDE